MPHSLTQRLRATPHLLSEVEGCTVVEPLIFIPIAAHPGSVGASALPGGRAASFHRFDHGCRNAAE